MTKYLNEYEVESNLTLHSNASRVEINPRVGTFRASISELKSVGENATLLIRMYLEADSIEDAEAKGQEFSKTLIQGLAVATSASWSPTGFLKYSTTPSGRTSRMPSGGIATEFSRLIQTRRFKPFGWRLRPL